MTGEKASPVPPAHRATVQAFRVGVGFVLLGLFGAALFIEPASKTPPGKLAHLTDAVAVVAALLLLLGAWSSARTRRPASIRLTAWLALHGAGLGLIVALVGEARETVGQPHLLFQLLLFAGLGIGAALDAALDAAGGALPASPRIVRMARRAHVVGLNVWVSWALLEVVVRVFVAVSGHQWVAVTGPAALPPHQPIHAGYRTNALGFYDEEFPAERAPDTAYVLALGDSFAFGVVPPPDNYLTRLETLWSARWGQRVEVLNCGVPGSGPEDYLALVRTLPSRLPVDAVLITVFLGNDITEWHPHRPFPALRHTYAVTALRRFLPVVTARWGPRAAPDALRFTDEEYLAIVRRRLAVCRRAPEDPAYARARRLLREIADVCKERNLPLAVVLAPDEFQVSAALQERLGGLDPAEFDLERPQRVLLPDLRRANVPAVDLLPALRRADRDAPTYVPNNTHWNAHGNAVAADTIAAQLPTRDAFRVPVVGRSRGAEANANAPLAPKGHSLFSVGADRRVGPPRADTPVRPYTRDMRGRAGCAAGARG